MGTAWEIGVLSMALAGCSGVDIAPPVEDSDASSNGATETDVADTDNATESDEPGSVASMSDDSDGAASDSGASGDANPSPPDPTDVDGGVGSTPSGAADVPSSNEVSGSADAGTQSASAVGPSDDGTDAAMPTQGSERSEARAAVTHLEEHAMCDSYPVTEESHFRVTPELLSGSRNLFVYPEVEPQLRPGSHYVVVVDGDAAWVEWSINIKGGVVMDISVSAEPPASMAASALVVRNVDDCPDVRVPVRVELVE